MYLEKSYVNTCNGVVLLAGGMPRPTTCVLWNPAVADEEREVTVPVSARDDCAILGLLLTRRQKPKELLVYALGGAGQKPRLRTLISDGLDGRISGRSFYMDGTIYLLHFDKSVILASDVDDETVTTVDLPRERRPWQRLAMSAPLVMSGRPCPCGLWLLTVEHRWERRCIIEGHQRPFMMQEIRNNRRDNYLIAGVWKCGGVLVVYLRMSSRKDGEDDKLFLHCTETKKLKVLNMPRSMTPEWSDYSLCWGYKPTLISPGSIAVNERDRRKGQKATLDTVCFMEFLLRIMLKLPENMQDVIGIPLLKSKASDSNFNNELYHSDSGSGSSVKDE
uniref:F-box associated domain-containing protein n=1 Tax=Setaria italica TaxID=4555 RepID=K4ALY3_SETIT